MGRIAIICAFKGELKQALKGLKLSPLKLKGAAGLGSLLLNNSKELDFVAVGVGEYLAEKGFKEFISQRRPELVYLLGIAGGLKEGLAIAQPIVASSLKDSKLDQEIVVKEEFSQQLLAVFSKLSIVPSRESIVSSGDKIICKSEEKKELADLSGAIAVDMEGYALAKVAKENNIPFASVRFISDRAEDNLPPLNKFFSLKAGMDIKAMASYFALRPHQALPLRQRSNKAFKQIAIFVKELIKSIS